MIWFFGWFVIVVPIGYWLGVAVSGYEENPDIVQGWGSDALDVAFQEVLVCLLLLSAAWNAGWLAIWRWVSRRAVDAVMAGPAG